MRDTPLAIVGIILLILLTILILTVESNKHIEFKKIELSDDISINNLDLPPYYDTILKVGMNGPLMDGTMVNVIPLSENAKSQFDGDLNAHIRYFDERFYLFIDNLDKSTAIQVLAHEIVHMEQYLKKDLIFDGKNVFWLGQQYDLSSTPYEVRPWERDAFNREHEISENIRKILIE